MKTITSNLYYIKIKNYIFDHKVKSSIIAVILIGLTYWASTAFSSSDVGTQYTVGAVSKGSIMSTISGTGQVSASNQVDLKPKASGDVVYIGAVSGDRVKKGTLVAMLDAEDAKKAVRDAEISLESTKISYEKLTAPADTLSLIQAENSLAQASTNLQKSYDSGFNSVSSAYLDLPTIMSGLDNLLYGNTVNRSQDNISAYVDMVKDYDERILIFKEDVVTKYNKARASYDKSFVDYRSVNRTSDTGKIEALVSETYDTTKDISDAIKSTTDMLNFVEDILTQKNQQISSVFTSHKNSLNSYTSESNSNLTSLLNAVNEITSSKYSLQEKTESLAELKAGADSFDKRSSELSLKQRENALQDAKDNLSNYYVVAPFDGLLAKMDVQKGDSISSGTSVGTLITDQRIAEISLNEVDISKVKIGQKATLTFDAISDLTITGKVVEVDTIGTVSQGVVSYSVKIAFDTEDERVKPGMSVSSSIITEMKQDILVVPNNAVKTSGDVSYVEVFEDEILNKSTEAFTTTVLPKQIEILTGISDDDYTEIVSGLNEGESIIVKTTTVKSKTATKTSTPSLLGGSSMGSGSMRATTGVSAPR